MEIIISQLTEVFNSFFNSSVLPNSIKWAAIAVALLLVELGHRAWLIIWFALGALSATIVAYLLPESIIAQFGAFFAVSVGSMAGFIYYRHHDEKSKPPVQIIPAGRRVRCTETIVKPASGVITVDGVEYKARLSEVGTTIEVGQWGKVAGFDVDELTVIVEPLEESVPQGGL